MRVTEEHGQPINLMPGDTLTVTVNRPQLVQVVGTHDGRPVSARLAKEWGTLTELRAEVLRLNGLVTRLRWQIDQLTTPDGEW